MVSRYRIVDLPRGFDLYTLYYPSFALPLVRVGKERFVKVWGVCRGLEVYFSSKNRAIVVHNDVECLEYADELLGMWFNLEYIIRRVEIRFEELEPVVEKLVEAYGWMGIATSSKDDIALFISIALSRNTDYHTNVLRWMNRIFELVGEDYEKLLDMDLTSSIARSYQVRQLPTMLRKYVEIRNRVLTSTDPVEVKRLLMEIPFSGPKVANAYMLFVKKNAAFAPVDKNLQQFLQKVVGLDIESFVVPSKSICRVDCSLCPYAPRCLEKRLRDGLGELYGWFQTVVYTHNKLFCRDRRCNTCPLRGVCVERKGSMST